MSRKNKTLRAFLHQNPNPTIEQAWDAAWKHAQKAFHARSMQDMKDRLDAVQAECERLRQDAERYRWLRDKCDRWDGGLVVAKVTEFSLSSWSGDDLNAAIDAAIERENKT